MSPTDQWIVQALWHQHRMLRHISDKIDAVLASGGITVDPAQLAALQAASVKLKASGDALEEASKSVPPA